MNISLKCENYTNLAATIQLVRAFTSESIVEVKNKILQKRTVAVIDTYDDDKREQVLNFITDLENSGADLVFFDEGDEPMTKKMFLAKYDRQEEISEQIERQDELRFTEIVVTMDKNNNLNAPFLHEDDLKKYYVFPYSEELLRIIKSKPVNAVYYKRDLNESDQNNWNQTTEGEILGLMRIETKE